MNREPTSREAFNPSTSDATPELSIYLTLLIFITTRGTRDSFNSFSSAFRNSGELARSISPITSKIVILSIRRAEICKGFSPFAGFQWARRLQILDQAKLVRASHAFEFHHVHALPDEMQPQSTGLDFVQPPALHFRRIGRGPAIAEQKFESVAGPARSAPLHPPHVQLDRLAPMNPVRMA